MQSKDDAKCIIHPSQVYRKPPEPLQVPAEKKTCKVPRFLSHCVVDLVTVIFGDAMKCLKGGDEEEGRIRRQEV